VENQDSLRRSILLICSGLAYSYGKVDHLILYDVAPLMLGLAGWGAKWSVDAYQRKNPPVSGYAVFVYASMVAFGLWTSAAAKVTTGWLDPARQATRFFVASDLEYGVTSVGWLAPRFVQVDSVLLWKFLDYATIFAEGWLVIAVFFPGLFRIGLITMSMFHVGVWLLLHIDFHLYAFVYIVFFLKPPREWFPELPKIRTLFDRLTPSPESTDSTRATLQRNQT
jgi:hypothetical protein